MLRTVFQAHKAHLRSTRLPLANNVYRCLYHNIPQNKHSSTVQRLECLKAQYRQYRTGTKSCQRAETAEPHEVDQAPLGSDTDPFADMDQYRQHSNTEHHNHPHRHSHSRQQLQHHCEAHERIQGSTEELAQERMPVEEEPDDNNEALAQKIREFLSSTRQKPRAGVKADELLVKCPACSPGKPRRLAYSAHLDTKTGSFVCMSCFEQGSWQKYQELAGRKHFLNTIPKRATTEPAPFEFGENVLDRLQKNLKVHDEIFTFLTGKEKGQLHLDPKVLRAYGVGLGFINPEKPEIDNIDRLIEGDDMSVPCLVFPRTAFRTNSFIEGGTGAGAMLAGSRDALEPTEDSSEYRPNSASKTGRDRNTLPSIVKGIMSGADEMPQSGKKGDAHAGMSVGGGKDGGPLYHTVQLKAVGWKTADLEMYYPVERTQPGLFGFHVASPESTEVIITGHELDALAAYQETGIPAMSLPRGPYQLPLDAMRALERFELVYVWLDDDHQGSEAANLITRKLGVDRCLVVHTRGNELNGPKSASIALAREYSLQKILEQNSKPVRHDKVLDFASLRDAVKFEITNPELIRGVESKDFPGWNSCFKGLRPGELTILSGPTGSGKTTILSQMSLDFCKSDVSTLWGSFEIPNVRLAARMMGQYAKKEISQAPEEFDYWSRKFGQLPIYFLKFHGSTEPNTVIETMKHAVYAYDVKHIIIDNLQFMMSMQGKGVDKYEAQDAAIATFRRFATDENVHITVVAHLRKDQPATGVDINSIFGSAKVTQEADNVVVLQRYGGNESNTRVLNVLKNRFDGKLGKIYVAYEPEALSFREIPSPRKRRSETKIIKPAGKLSISDLLHGEAGEFTSND